MGDWMCFRSRRKKAVKLSIFTAFNLMGLIYLDLLCNPAAEDGGRSI
jgi:hypothetical protein